ncbi:MAG: NUDIX hydrolase [Patescibacteria group bacterium]
MQKLISDEEYYGNLPKKHIGACVLIFNKNKKLLIVKPTYKEGWSIPGGGVDTDESPKMAAIREVKEEVGLDFKNITLVGVGYTPVQGIKPETLQFVFYSGNLEANEVDKIILDRNEHSEFRFVEISEASILLNEKQKRWLSFYTEKIENKNSIYIEL